jgi:hypothetical protein
MFLWRNPQGNQIWQEDETFDNDSEQQVNRLPRLHAVCYRKVDLDDLVDKTEPMETDQTLMTLLTATLGNETAAEALLVSLSSRAERETISDSNDTRDIVDTYQNSLRHHSGMCLSEFHFAFDRSLSCHSDATAITSDKTSYRIVGRVDLNDKGLSSPIKNGPHLVPSQLQLPRGAMIILCGPWRRRRLLEQPRNSGSTSIHDERSFGTIPL